VFPINPLESIHRGTIDGPTFLHSACLVKKFVIARRRTEPVSPIATHAA
jgi:hypothetical protein